MEFSIQRTLIVLESQGLPSGTYILEINFIQVPKYHHDKNKMTILFMYFIRTLLMFQNWQM